MSLTYPVSPPKAYTHHAPPPPAQVELPGELLHCLPRDSLQMLSTANDIAMYAFTQRVRALEAENATLRTTFTRSQSQIKALENQCVQHELENKDLQEKLAAVEHERDALMNEKSALISTVKRLNRDISKAEGLKMSLMRTLQDESGLQTVDLGKFLSASFTPALAAPPSPPPALPAPTGAAGLSTPAQPRTSALASATTPLTNPLRNSYTPQHPYDNAASQWSHPRYTPLSATSRLSGAASTPGTFTPGSAAADPSPLHKSPGGRVDGKVFFRQARARLPPESFSKFLQNIKELNAHKKSHEEALQLAKALLTEENADLYEAFESMIGPVA